jgi:hemolysin activation/secretion protein
MISVFSKYARTNASLQDIIHAASDLELAYIRQGYPTMNIVVAPKRIANGIVTLDVFPGAVPQVVVGGNRYVLSTNGVEFTLYPPPPPPPVSGAASSVSKRTTTTNAGPRFVVNKYQILGNTILPPETLNAALTNVPGAFGTNVSIDTIREVVIQLDTVYRTHGFVTVAVGLPPQRLTNATVKLQVTEGRLNEILVKGNHYFSSNNVMRAVPGLYSNMILNGTTFQAEVDRANANQDRQISPIIEPGPNPGTSDLTLQVKDRLPVHAKVELNNENSPGTPDLRLNSSAVYGNLWQQEQSLGVQYSFSPEQYKEGPQWNFYDLPSVANYSTFYRIPLGSPGAIDDEVAANPGTFGYNEATRKFILPPVSGQPDLTFFASRSTIDNGLTSSLKNLYTSQSTNSTPPITNSVLNLENTHQDITINNDLGFRFNYPLATASGFHMAFSGGLDFKSYEETSVGTNTYLLSSEIIDTLSGSSSTNFNNSSDTSTLPKTYNRIYYAPLALRYDAGWHDFLGDGTVGLGLSVNLWDTASSQKTSYGTYYTTNQTSGVITTNSTSTSGSLSGTKALQAVTGSTESNGRWVALTPSFSHTFQFVTNWVTTFRADGQWASEPLISNEQFGAGGVNSVRGYQEGEVFGDTGWRLSLQQDTPPHVVGMVAGRIPLVVRGSIYMDYAHIYLLDPQGRPPGVALWGTGFGIVTSIGSSWQTRFLFSVPLLDTTTTTAYHPFFDFSLTAQF